MNNPKLLLIMGITLFFLKQGTANLTGEFDLNTPLEFNANYSEEKIRSAVMNSNSVFAKHYDSSVQYFVKDNLYYGRRGFAKTLGRTQIYYPVIEQHLEMYGIPKEIKHLVIVESHANPLATSSVGAKGLWQMMPETARRYGLVVNKYQDDRKDPRKSTEAAVRYLQYLYNFLNRDWTAAIAAYNCGEGRVRQAMRQANSYDYEKYKHFLPKQTQKYIPALIAASYSVENAASYGVQPYGFSYELRFTHTLKVFEQLSFAEIASITNTPINTIQQLNPSYLRGYIPTSKRGNYVVLPSISTGHLRNFLRRSNRYSVEMR